MAGLPEGPASVGAGRVHRREQGDHGPVARPGDVSDRADARRRGHAQAVARATLGHLELPDP